MTEHAGQRIEAQFAPQLIQRPHIAQGKGRFKLNLGGGHIAWPMPARLEQRLQELIDLPVVLVDTAKG